MKTRLVQQREGEYLGPVDWNYDFRSHFNSYCCSDEKRQKMCEESKEQLRKLEAEPDKWLATTDGGWPRMWWHRVLRVGMYDGWPYWRPTPFVLTAGTLGPEWNSFDSITGIIPAK